MAEVITNPKNVIPTVVYLRGNEVSRIPHEGTTKYNIATDEQIQSIINSFSPGGEGDDARYDVATDEQIQDIISGNNEEEENEEVSFEEDEYNVASDDDILDIIDEFNNNGNN